MFLHRLALTAALVGSLAAAPAAIAAASGAAAIDGVDVEQVAELAAGVALRFAVYGTPNAAVSLRIEGGWHALALREGEPGVYEGIYVIDGRDAIAASSRVTATLQRGGALASAELDEPLLLATAPLPWADPPPATAAAPPPATVAAPPPAVARDATASPAAAARPVPPAVAPAAAPIAVPPVVPPAVLPTVVARSPQRVTCDGCAFVQSVRMIEPTPGGPIGALAGAIAGAVLGRELGEAHHRRMLTLLGAIGGGIAGHEIGKQATRTQYDVVVRTGDGRTQVLRFDRPPSFAPGDTVRLGAARGEATPF